jgi:hypothetical protein
MEAMLSSRRLKKGPGRRPLSAKRQKFMELLERGRRSLLTAPPEPNQNVPEGGAQDWSPAMETTSGTGVGIAVKLGMPASTVHAVLVRMRINKLHHIDKRTGEVVRRYEHPYPGSMIHVDVTKFGNIPDGGGHRFVGRRQGIRNRLATVGAPRSKNHDPNLGKAFVHTVVDDHSRVAYAEVHGDETAVTAVGVLKRAVSWFAARGVVVERVLSDNGSAYRSHYWRDSCAELGITPKKTRPYRPQTNGKIERFHRTLADGWAFRRMYSTETARRNALPGWLHEYNHHRPHTAIGGHPPISRLTNVPGQYI